MLGAFIKTAADRPAAHIRGHDGIGRHARFRCCHLSGEVFVKIAARFLLLIYAGMMKLVNMLDLGAVTSVKDLPLHFRRP